MSRPIVRFVVILAVGLGILYVVGSRERAGGPRESPTLTTGPLGDMGARVPGGGGSGVQINPIRDVVITLLEQTGEDAERSGEFRAVGELRGSRAEFRTPQRQRISDAVAVYELRPVAGTSRDESREVFEAVVRYRPLTQEDAAAARAARAETPGRAEIAYLRIQAAEAVIMTPRSEKQVQFLGGPPEGVAITLFEADGTPVLEVRTDRLLCTHPEPFGPNRFVITSDKLVRLFTPDGLYRLQGEGLWGVLEQETEAGGPRRGRFRLLHRIRFEAADGFRGDRTDPGPRRLTREQTTVTADGPAVLALHQTHGDAVRKDVVFDAIELHRAVRIEDRRRFEDAAQGLLEDLETDLTSDSLQLQIRDRVFEAADASGDVRIRSFLRRTRAGNPPRVVESTTVTTGERARLLFAGRSPRRLEIHAWSVQLVPTGLRLGGPIYLPVPVHRPPHVEGSFRDPETEHARFEASSDGDLVLESLDRDPTRRRGRLILEKNIRVDIEGLRRVPARGVNAAEAGGFTPGQSRFFVRDRFVFDHLGEPGRLAEFTARGAVRAETLLGNLEAQSVDGLIRSRDSWRIEADGDPRFDLPLASRSAPEVVGAFRRLSLAPAVPGGRPAEASGRLVIEGRRAVLEVLPAPDGSRSAQMGRARFTDAVRLTQTELTTEPIVLLCRDLRFAFASAGGPAGPAMDPGSFVAEGDVVLEAGRAVRATGDRLTLSVATRSGAAGGETPGAAGRAARLRLDGFPARIAAAAREGDAFRLEGRTLHYDGLSRSASARTGVLIRFLPAKGDFMLPGGAPHRSVTVRAVEIEAEEATVSWDRRNLVRALRAAQAVRIRGFDRAAEREPAGAESAARLVQWADADELAFDVLPGEADSKPTTRRLVLRGDVEQPVRVGYRGPAGAGEDDMRLAVPVIAFSGPVSPPDLTEVRGYGAGSVLFRSQDNVFSSSARSGPGREKSLRVSFDRGFLIRRISPESFRLDFLDGGQVESRDAEGKLEAWLLATRELGLLLDNSARENDEDFRVVERGYARGDVRFRYGDDARGGGDEAFWERGTNVLTLVGSPAWGERAGEPRQEFQKMTYNRATRRFDLYRGSGQLRHRFERKDEP